MSSNNRWGLIMKTFKYLLVIIGLSMLSNAGITSNTSTNEEVQTLAGNDSRGARDNDKSVPICHRTNGKNGYFELWVPIEAVPGHLGHGDRLGRCELTPT